MILRYLGPAQDERSSAPQLQPKVARPEEARPNEMPPKGPLSAWLGTSAQKAPRGRSCRGSGLVRPAGGPSEGRIGRGSRTGSAWREPNGSAAGDGLDRCAGLRGGFLRPRRGERSFGSRERLARLETDGGASVWRRSAREGLAREGWLGSVARCFGAVTLGCTDRKSVV